MKMLKNISLTAVLISAVVLSAVAEPVLKVRQERFEMGTIPPHSTVSHSFWFKSAGTDTAVIDSIVTRCGCMDEPSGVIRVPPGDSVKINFCWKVPEIPGARGGYPYIYTNTDKRALRVYMTGTITKSAEDIRPVSFSPFILDMSRFGEKSVDSLVFEVRNSSDEDLTLTKLSFDIDECEITLPAVIPAGSSAKGLAKVKPEYLDKEFKKSFTLQVNDLRKTRLTVPVRRRIF